MARTPFITFVGIAPTIGDAAIGQSILQGLKANLDLPVHVRTSRRDVFATLPELGPADAVMGKLPSIPAPAVRSAAFPFRLQQLLRALRRSGGAGTLPPAVAAALREAFDGCAALVLQGGPNWNDRMMDAGRALQRWLLLETARHYGARVYHVGVSCGPFAWTCPRRLWMSRLARPALNQHDILFVRDSYSRPALERLGVTARVVESTDAAVFLQPHDDPAFAHVERILRGTSGRPRVVVCVRDYQPAYPDARAARTRALQALARVVDEVQRQIADVYFLSTDHNPSVEKETDVAIARQVQAMMTAPGSTLVEEDVRHPAALKQIYGQFDAMISMRLHPTILALGSGVPCLVLSYDDKCRDFFASVDLEDFALPLGGFEPAAGLDLLRRMLADPEVRRRVRDGYRRLQSTHARDLEPMYGEIASRADAIRRSADRPPAPQRGGRHHG